MTFSIGQNFFNDLLENSSKTTHNDKKAIEQAYLLTQRLADFWKNNDIPVLLKSKKYSGMPNLLGEPEALGGPINFSRTGTNNAPGSCKDGCCSEFPFWGKLNEKDMQEIDKKLEGPKENFENLNNVVEQPKIIENFTVKENFNKPSNTLLSIIIIISIILIFGIFLFFKQI